MDESIIFVGLDVHKETISVALAEGGVRGEVREYGRIANTAAALKRLVGKIGGEGIDLRFCYEAGPCGYGIQRWLTQAGDDCIVVAPSLIPRRSGERINPNISPRPAVPTGSGGGALSETSVLGGCAMRPLVDFPHERCRGWVYDDGESRRAHVGLSLPFRVGGAAQAGGARSRVWARAKAIWCGQAEAMAILMRRAETVTRAPIFRSLRRMVPQVAVANSVCCRARRRSAAIST